MRRVLPLLVALAVGGLALATWAIFRRSSAEFQVELSEKDAARLSLLLKDAARLVDERNLEAARSVLEDALRIDPSNPEAARILAASYRQESNFRRAIEIIDAAVGSHPRHVGLLLERGEVLEALGDFAKARDDYRAVVEIDPGRSEAYLRLGLAEMKMNRFAEAMAAARRALDLGLDEARTHLLLGTAAAGAADAAAAEAAFRACLDREPSLLEAHYRLGRLLVREGRREEGEEELERAARLSRLVVEIEDIQAEVEAYRSRGVASDPGKRRMRVLALSLSRAYIDALRFHEAEVVLREVMPHHPRDGGLAYLLGLSLLGQGKGEEAMTSFREAARLDPGSDRPGEAILRTEAWLGESRSPGGSSIPIVEALLKE